MKIQPGDLVRIPTFVPEKYGLVQILKIDHPKRKSNAFAVLFSVLYTKEELAKINENDIENLEIISAMPIDLYSIRSRSPKKWKIIKNLPSIAYPVPMFKLYSPRLIEETSTQDTTIIVDFSFSYFRNIDIKDAKNNPNYFTRSSKYFEDLIEINFFNPNLINQFPETYIYKWKENYITENDMKINSDKYEKWLGWASSWKDL